MNIKNFKINQSVVKKAVSYVLAGTLSITALTGCAKNSLLDGTILDKALVLTFEDGTKDIVRVYSDCADSDYSHYKSIITGTYIADTFCKREFEGFLTPSFYHKKPIVAEESILTYLTNDEIAKFNENSISDEDISTIILRVITPVETDYLTFETDNLTR